jgi:nicotinamide phosphoribosyltransferase
LNPIFLADFYKYGHVEQYPTDVVQVWSNWTPRKSRLNVDSVVHFGLQYFVKKYLIETFNEEFFDVPLEYLLDTYRDVISTTLGVKNPKTDHIEQLHELGYLPVKIYSLPEGVSAGLGIPTVVITNTVPEAYWLPNFLETLMSNILWKPCTSATMAREYRKVFMKYAKMAGETDFSFVDWQGHDFSMRGMSGVEDAILSGMGHLLSFNGTDTLPAILAASEYYNATLDIGGSVPATEHSVMSAGSKEGEFETFRRLIEDVYPTGVVSIVSDTWDLWKVLTDYIPRLKKTILARDGKIVIRPDSGDPVKILCGDPDVRSGPASLGVLELLSSRLGLTWGDRDSRVLPLIRNAGAIYGDSITLERAEQIMNRTVNELQLSPYNVVLGIGSFTYEYCTRDTHGFAMKATAVRRSNGEIVPIFKDPVTDSGLKKSLKGIPTVYETDISTDSKPDYFVLEDSCPKDLDNCAYWNVFENGDMLIEQDFADIRGRVRACAQ